MSAEPPESSTSSYGRGARVAAIGIGATGLVTYAYFGLASHSLSTAEYGRITLLWSAIFIVCSILYRPVEQLLSRTIADRRARGTAGTEHFRVAATIQLGLGLLFLVAALLLRDRLEQRLFGGSETLYWILVVSVLAYAASYFARGFLAGHGSLGLYGALVFVESVTRCMFGVLAVVGVATSQGFVATGMAAAPILSLVVVPWALGRRIRSGQGDPHDAEAADVAALEEPAGEAEFTLSRGAGFAGAVLLVMVCEQAFLNAGPLIVQSTAPSEGTVLAGFAFNVLFIARAPMQLFQAIQTAILPHLTGLAATDDHDPFRRSVSVTVRAIAAFSLLVSAGLALVGPFAMHLLFGDKGFDYDRGGLVLVGLGMGLYLAAATFNQAALAHGRAAQAAACWVLAAAVFVVLLLLPGWDDLVLQVEVAYLAGSALLCALLYGLYRASAR